MVLDKYGHYFLTHFKELSFKVNLDSKNYENHHHNNSSKNDNKLQW